MIVPCGWRGCWPGPEALALPGMVNVAETFFLFFLGYILTNLTYPQDCWTVEQSHWCWRKRIEIQANIQGIHCIIKVTTGMKRWSLLGKCVVSRKEKKKVSTSMLSGLYLLPLHPTPFVEVLFSARFLLLYLRSLLDIQNTSPRQPQHICLALHSGQRFQFSSVTLLSFFFSSFIPRFFLVVVPKPQEMRRRRRRSHFVHSTNDA